MSLSPRATARTLVFPAVVVLLADFELTGDIGGSLVFTAKSFDQRHLVAELLRGIEFVLFYLISLVGEFRTKI